LAAPVPAFARAFHGLDIRMIPIVFILLLAPNTFANAESKPVHVLLETEVGEIELELYPSKAPITVKNFVRYVELGFYNGGQFHRTVTPANQPQNKVKIEVVQAGADPGRESQSFPPIPLERTNTTGVKHLNGTISMARDGPDTATSDFFICIGDQPDLDFEGKRNPDGQGFAAFGRVTRGMDAVRKIQASPADGQKLAPAIVIRRATVMK
jgi:peptidyl-prolyl cis-trans isomerase A (cyclophilin A)